MYTMTPIRSIYVPLCLVSENSLLSFQFVSVRIDDEIGELYGIFENACVNL